MASSSTLIALALALAASPAAAGAQAMVQPLPARTDADRLADTMRQLAASPQDVNALASAGELSLKLDDLTAAAGFFARADKVDPRNARVKAGEGALMVRSERPGEALRYFAQAESYGGVASGFAADRGLAYDLVGDQERAQREYRLAIKAQPQDDETVRRYALSLGIAGKRDQALSVLEPLLRKTDRAAWRSRAFILAMNGDQAGAERIATTMMPPGMAQGLLPFFQRLPTLPVVDRAFAVHFGEVRASAERMADARMAPAVAPLAPEPPVQVAAASAAQPAVQPAKKARDRRSKREREAAVAVAAAPTPSATTLPPPPVYASRPGVALASTSMAPPQPVVQRLPQTSLPAAQAYRTPTAPPLVAARVQPLAAPVVIYRPPTVTLISQPPLPVIATPAPVAVAVRSLPAPGFVSAPAVTPAPAPAHPVARVSEDNILARIIAGLSIPAAELDAAPPPRVAPAPVQVAANDDADRLAAQAAAEKVAADRVAAEHKAALDKRAADRKAAAEKKALAAKKAAAEAKALADKEAAEERKAARANPERIWVQVAGGANEDDLPKAWKAVKAKAPDIFGSRGGWSTPLRATNRVLAGPFKTSDEARDFVNDLKKKGVSAFTFTSEAGQPVAKLPK